MKYFWRIIPLCVLLVLTLLLNACGKGLNGLEEPEAASLPGEQESSFPAQETSGSERVVAGLTDVGGGAAYSPDEFDPTNPQDTMALLEFARVGTLEYLESTYCIFSNEVTARLYLPLGYHQAADGRLIGIVEDIQVAADELLYKGDMLDAIEADYERIKASVAEVYEIVEESNYMTHPDYIAHLRSFVFVGDDGIEMTCTRIFGLYNDITAENFTTALLTYTVWTDAHDSAGNGTAILDEIARAMDVQFPPMVLARV